MWVKRKLKPRKLKPIDAKLRLDVCIDSMYHKNPFGSFELEIYKLELMNIIYSVEIRMSAYNNFLCLLNEEIEYYFYRGVKIRLAQPETKKSYILGSKKLFVETTNLRENKPKD